MSEHDTQSGMFAGLGLLDLSSDREASLIFEALGQGLCLCDVTGRIIWSNRVMARYPAGLSKRVEEVCQSAVQGFAGGGQKRPKRRKRSRIHHHRADRHFEVTVTALTGPSELEPAHAGTQRAAIVAVVRDVTASERLRRKVAAIDEAGSELVKLDADVIEKLHVAERLKLLESKVVRHAHDLLHFDHFAIRLLNEKTNELELVMATGFSPKACAIKLYARQDDNGISGRVAATGRSYTCNDTSRDPMYVYGIDEAGSSLTVPLKLFDKVLGIFNVESAKVNAFGEHDRLFAEIFGRYIAMALYILNLLLVERYTTNQKTTGTVQGELTEPLNDLVAEAEALKDETLDPEAQKHIERILRDVDSIRRRIKSAAKGPQTLLGADEALERSEIDPVLEGKRILVAENEPDISGTIREVFQRRGAVVTECGDGESAIKLLDQWRVSLDPDQGYDLVLSDISMGDRTGYDVFAAAKSASRNIPVILMTGFGYDPHHSIVRASQEGLQCVLFKPFQVDKLLEEARKALTAQGAGPIM